LNVQAEKAGLDFPFKNWLDVVKQSKGIKRYTSLYPREQVILGLPSRYNIRKGKRKYGIVRQPKEVMPMLGSAVLPK
jgi:hypothetical protein